MNKNRSNAVLLFSICINNILTFNFGMLRKIYILVEVKI